MKLSITTNPLKPLAVMSSVALLLITLGTSSCNAPGAAVGVVGAGITTKMFLGDLDDRVGHMAQVAVESGSLGTSAAIGNLQLMLDATRSNMHDEMDIQWNNLDKEKVDMLRELNAQVETLQKTGKAMGNVEDAMFLDTDTLASRVPFANGIPRIRHVDGASQSFKKDGDYKVHVVSNLLIPFGPTTKVSLKGGTPLTVVPSGTYGADIVIPHDTLQFDNFHLKYVPLIIETEVTEGKFIKANKLREYRVPLILYPRYVGAYQFEQTLDVPSINEKDTIIKKGETLFIAGCGDPGCNVTPEVCADFPTDGQYIGIVNPSDTLDGYFGGFTGAPKVEVGRVCQHFWQHSHNRPRNVSISVAYHPGKFVQQASPIALTALEPGQTPKPFCTLLNAVSGGSTNLTEPSSVGTSDSVCWIEFGKTYLAEMAAESKGYKLVVHMFNGANYFVIDGATEKVAGIDVNRLPSLEKEPKHVTFKFKEPS